MRSADTVSTDMEECDLYSRYTCTALLPAALQQLPPARSGWIHSTHSMRALLFTHCSSVSKTRADFRSWAAQIITALVLEQSGHLCQNVQVFFYFSFSWDVCYFGPPCHTSNQYKALMDLFHADCVKAKRSEALGVVGYGERRSSGR